MNLIKSTGKVGINAIYEGNDDDNHIVALNGNDVINANGGNDRINAGGGDDAIDGGSGDDQIVAGNGDDSVTGGEGDDFLHGNGGADTFHYSFDVTPGSVTVPICNFVDLDEDGKLTENEFVHQYNDWLRELGLDMNADDAIAVKNHNGSPDDLPEVEGFDGTFGTKSTITVHTGNTTQTRYYVDSATVGGAETVTSDDGNDTIADFHVGLDKLDFGTLTAAQLAQFQVNDTADVNGDEVLDTVITLTGDGDFSITLLGVSGHSLEAFFG